MRMDDAIMGRDRRRSSLTSGRSDGGGGKGEVEGVKDMVAKKGWTRTRGDFFRIHNMEKILIWESRFFVISYI